MNIAIAALAASMIVAPATTGPVETYEEAIIMCNSTYDDPSDCVDAAIITDWEPATTMFVAHTLETDFSILVHVSHIADPLDRDLRVCDLAFPTLYDVNDDRYAHDPTVFALDACISDTLSNHRATM